MTKGTIRYDLCLRMVSCTIGLYTIRRERVRMIHHLSTWAIYSNFALKKWKIHQGESFEGRLTLAPIEKTTPPPTTSHSRTVVHGTPIFQERTRHEKPSSSRCSHISDSGDL